MNFEYISNYINENIDQVSDYKDSIIKLISIKQFLNDNKISLSLELLLYLLENNNYFFKMNELLFDKYKTQIENDTISMVIDDNFIISSLEAFCVKQNIEIKTDDEKYIDCENSLMLYLNEISNFSVLSREEERRLAIKIKNGDIEAKKIFIQNNLRLVVSIAKKYRCKIMSFLDLIQEGNLGLMKALDGYDVSKGYKFSTYATWWIKQSIRLAIIKKGNEIRVPTGVYENVNNYKKKEEELSVILGRDPTDFEMPEVCNIPISEVRKMKSILLLQNHSTSLNSLVNDETTSTFEDFLPTPDEPIENLASLSMLNAEILTLFDSCNLKEREKEILVLRYGLNGNNPMKLIEVAQEYDLTHERIRQIESNAINKIRNGKKIDDFLIYMSNPKEAKKRLYDFRENYKKDKKLRYKKSI